MLFLFEKAICVDFFLKNIQPLNNNELDNQAKRMAFDG